MVLFGARQRKGFDVQKLLAIILVLAISGCAGSSASTSKYNPLNWFGGNEEEVTLEPRGGFEQAVDRRPRVGRVTKVSLERTSYGLILHAQGSLPSHGYHDLELVASTEARSDQLIYEFKGWPPTTNASPGNKNQLEVSTAIFLSKQAILGIREITIITAENQMSRRP